MSFFITALLLEIVLEIPHLHTQMHSQVFVTLSPTAFCDSYLIQKKLA